MSDDLPLEGLGSTENEPAMPSAYSGPVMAFLKQCFIFVVTAAVFSGGMGEGAVAVASESIDRDSV